MCHWRDRPAGRPGSGHRGHQEVAMSTTDVQRQDAGRPADVTNIDMKVEVIVIPVADVDRATEFYRRLGWRLDVTPPTVVQLTPHGSACSVQFGRTLTSAAPGSGRGYLVVSDLAATRDALVGAGVEVSEIFHISPDGPVSGPGSGTPELLLARHVHRPRRQRVAAPGDHDPAARPGRLRHDVLRLHERPRRGVPAGRGRPRRAREAHRPGRRRLARLVRRLHGGRAGRHGAALMSATEKITINTAASAIRPATGAGRADGRADRR